MDINSLVGMMSDPSALKTTTIQAAQSTDDPDASTETQSAAAAEEFDTFLRLLTAQIQNQDPLAPIDSTQFVEQLATFSSLELQATGNAYLAQIVTQLAAQDDNAPLV